MKAHAFGLSASRVPDDNSNPATEKSGLKEASSGLGHKCRGSKAPTVQSSLRNALPGPYQISVLEPFTAITIPCNRGPRNIVTSLSPEALRDCRARGAEVAVRSRCSAHGGDLAEVGHQGGEVTSGDTLSVLMHSWYGRFRDLRVKSARWGSGFSKGWSPAQQRLRACAKRSIVDGLAAGVRREGPDPTSPVPFDENLTAARCFRMHSSV